MVKKFIYWRVRVKLRVNRGIVEMFWWKKKTAEFSFTDVNRLWADPPKHTHTHTNNHLIEFLPLPSVSHLIVSPRRDFVQRGTNLKASNTESLDRKFSLFFFFYIYASNVNYQWTAEGQNLLSLQLWHIWIWTTIHINAVLNALCVCFLPEKTFEATTSWTNRHNLVAVAASVPVQNTLLHLFWPER